MNGMAILINGEPDTAIPAEDRGFLYGDGLFETIAVSDGQGIAFELHWNRLNRGCQILGLECPDRALLAKETALVCAGHQKAVAKIMVTRGEGARGYAPSECHAPLRVVASYPWPDDVPQRQERGIAVKTSGYRLADQGPLAGIKHMSRLEQVMAGRELGAGTFSELLLVDAGGRLVEALSSNIFVVAGGFLRTPCLDRCGVAGIMRERVLSEARKLSLRTSVEDLPLTILAACEEMFLTNSISGIVPVRQLNRRSLAVGPMTRRLQRALHGDWPA